MFSVEMRADRLREWRVELTFLSFFGGKQNMYDHKKVFHKEFPQRGSGSTLRICVMINDSTESRLKHHAASVVVIGGNHGKGGKREKS